MIAAGSFLLNGTNYYLAQWNFNSLAWTSLGSANALLGPVTAVSTDNGDVSKVFVAGTSLQDEPYLSFWNGSIWSDFNSGVIEHGSGVQQLVFVPTLSQHPTNSMVESDRVLLVSGSLKINETSYASALYDGENWFPYLVASTETGSAGVVSSLFYSISNFNLSGRREYSLRFSADQY